MGVSLCRLLLPLEIKSCNCSNKFFRLVSPFSSPSADAKIEFSYECSRPSCHYSGSYPRTRTHAGRIRKDRQTAWRTRTYSQRAWHLQRDVERALLVQVFPRASEKIAHAQQAGGAGPGRKRWHH